MIMTVCKMCFTWHSLLSASQGSHSVLVEIYFAQNPRMQNFRCVKRLTKHSFIQLYIYLYVATESPQSPFEPEPAGALLGVILIFPRYWKLIRGLYGDKMYQFLSQRTVVSVISFFNKGRFLNFKYRIKHIRNMMSNIWSVPS